MANRFWVGGAGDWDASTTTHWAATTGGAGGQTVPGTSDAVIFDANSGGGTVTRSVDVSVQSITAGAFTGTLDFSAHNKNATLSASAALSISGTGARTIKLGNGTYSFTATGVTITPWSAATTTNLTFDAGQSTLDFTGVTASVGNRTFQGGGLTYGTVRVRAQANGSYMSIAGTNTFANLIADGQNVIKLQADQTVTTLTISGTASDPVALQSSSDLTQRTISVASNAPTISYAALRDIICTGGASFVANNSFDLGNNSGITINGPTGGGMLFIPDMAGT